MARKSSEETPGSRGLHDVIGLVLLASSILIFASLATYDRLDLGFNTTQPNVPPHNYIGSVGAHIGYVLFLVFGAAAYLIPPIAFFVGLGNLLALLSFVQRRWLWSGVLLITSMGLLDLYADWLNGFKTNLGIASPGGVIGNFLNVHFFAHFGVLGATIVLATGYLISLLYLTNFKLGEALREIYDAWEVRRMAAEKDRGLAVMPDEKLLDKKARALEKEQRKLEKQLEKEAAAETEKSGLGADLQPVPEPTVRDLSIPQARGKKGKVEAPAASEALPANVMQEGDVITATEIAAASTADVLGLKENGEAKNGEKEPLKGRTPGGDEDMPALPPPKIRLGPKKAKPITVASTPIIGDYKLPSLDLLHLPDPTVRPTETKEELMANAKLMQNTLAQFQIDVSLGDITKGPTITRYELHPAPGVKLEKIAALNNNIAAALKAERINILAPVPGKSSVGVEVPNLVKTKVIMRDIMESDEWHNTKARIPLALGKDVYGHPIIADLAEMPHLLIAGSTGSGKSVCINSIIASLLYRFSPDQLRFVMIDPKVVELQQYNSLPHLVVPVVNDPKKVILALRWVVNEMEKRYQIFAKVGVRNIKSFNERPKVKPVQQDLFAEKKKEKEEKTGKHEGPTDGMAVELDEEITVPREDDIVIPEKLSYVVVIIDELADLMLVAPADVEMAIARITQMARAAGIHCIVATQRPSVDVITGVIKANIPARIAFQVAAKVDSRTILDAMGADKLLGKGDMLYLPPGSAKLTRAQGVLITDQEIQSIVDHISKQGKPSYEMEIHQQLSKPVTSMAEESGCDEDEEIIQQCIEVIRSEQKASVSLLQRRLRLGYGRAARVMDELENRGIVGPANGAEPREILLDLDGGGADGRPKAAANAQP
jgi:S-DNA-T family DNA segregation ATPase FtsK/SpoIIIE